MSEEISQEPMVGGTPMKSGNSWYFRINPAYIKTKQIDPKKQYKVDVTEIKECEDSKDAE